MKPRDTGIAALVEAYRRTGEERMHSLPFFNERLAVEAVGFRAWEGHLVGVLISPWFMNLVLLPGEKDDWATLAERESSEWHFPAGTYRFHPCRLESADLHLSAALFPDVTAFPDQATARAVGVEVMKRLFDRAGEEAPDAGGDCGVEAILETPIDRRGLLTWLSGPRDA